MKTTVLGLITLLSSGCSSPTATGVRIIDDNGAPLAGAMVKLTHSVPYTIVAPKDAGPTDENGYVAITRHKVNSTSQAVVSTPTEVVIFNASKFGALREGVLTLSTWRGFRDRTLEAGFGDGLHVPSIYLLKDENQ